MWFVYSYKIIEPVKVKNLTILSNEEYAVNASIESTLNVPAEVLDLLTNDKVSLIVLKMDSFKNYCAGFPGCLRCHSQRVPPPVCQFYQTV